MFLRIFLLHLMPKGLLILTKLEIDMKMNLTIHFCLLIMVDYPTNYCKDVLLDFVAKQSIDFYGGLY